MAAISGSDTAMICMMQMSRAWQQRSDHGDGGRALSAQLRPVMPICPPALAQAQKLSVVSARLVSTARSSCFVPSFVACRTYGSTARSAMPLDFPRTPQHSVHSSHDTQACAHVYASTLHVSNKDHSCNLSISLKTLGAKLAAEAKSNLSAYR